MSQLGFFPFGFGHYEAEYYESLDVDTEVTRVANLLAQFDVTLAAWDTAMRERNEQAARRRLQDWAAVQGRPNTILYWLGHGWSNQAHAALAAADSPEGLSNAGVTPYEFARHIITREGEAGEDAWAVVIIDACASKRFVELLSAELARDPNPPQRIMVIGTSGDGATQLGGFSTTLDAVLSGDFLANETIGLTELALQLRRRADYLVYDHALHRVELRRRSGLPAGLVVPLDTRAELKQVLDQLGEDERHHFIPKGQGAELGEPSWFFRGRDEERTRISGWLHTAEHGLFVVTGAPGVGKSALLGHLVMLSHRPLRELLVHTDSIARPPEGDRPPDGAFDIVLHLAGMTPDMLVDQLAALLDIELPSSTTPVTRRVAELLARVPRLTLLVDALDEAEQPVVIARDVLRPLGDHPTTRVVVGTRMSSRHGMGHGDRDLLDALAGEHTTHTVVVDDPAATTSFVQARLRAEGVAEERIAAFAPAIASQGFLFARLAAHELTADPSLADPSELEDSPGSLFSRACRRLSAMDPAYSPLLIALSLAEGRGLPIKDGVWATVATALTNTTVTERQISELLTSAAPYLTAGLAAGQTVYRLAHRSFTEQLGATSPKQAQRRQERIAAALVSALVPATGSNVDNNPYLVEHLASHVAAAGEQAWHRLAANPAVLDRINPMSVAANAMTSLFSRASIPAEIAGVIGAQHRLRELEPAMRTVTRQVAMVRYGGVTGPRHELETRAPGTLTVRWARIRPYPVHLVLAGDLRSVTALTVVTVAGGRVLLVVGDDDGTVLVWDPATAQPASRPLVSRADGISALAVLAGGNGRVLLATGDHGGRLRVWDPIASRPVGRPWVGHPHGVSAMAAFTASDGHPRLVTAGWDDTVRIWDHETGQEHATLPTGHAHGVSAMATFTANGRTLLATGGLEGAVRIWKPETLRRVGADLTGHGARVRAIVPFPSADGRTLLATGGWDNTVRIWDPSTGEPAGGPLTGVTMVNAIAVFLGRDGRSLLATGSRDDTVRIWDALSGEPAGDPLAGHTSEVTAAVSFNYQDGRALLATGGSDGTVRVWDVATAAATGAEGEMAGAPRVSASTAGATVVGSFTRPDGDTMLVTGAEDGTVSVWDTEGRLDTVLTGHVGAVESLLGWQAPDGRAWLATGGKDRTVRIWDPVAGEQRGEPLTGHAGRVCAITAFTAPDDGSTVLATGAWEGPVRLWDPSTGAPVGVLTGHTSRVCAITAFADPDDGRPLLATGSDDRTIRVWHLPAGRQAEPVNRIAHRVSALTTWTNQDGRVLLAAGGRDGLVRLWDPSTGAPVGVLTGHTSRVCAITAFADPDDGRPLLATGSDDNTVRIWDPRRPSATTVADLLLPVRSLAADAGLLVAGTTEGFVVLELEPDLSVSSVGRIIR